MSGGLPTVIPVGVGSGVKRPWLITPNRTAEDDCDVADQAAISVEPDGSAHCTLVWLTGLVPVV
jgi:hypothetical protein